MVERGGGIGLRRVVGVIDTVRAQQLLARLLESIVETESRVAILDVTGVPIIDTSVARHLLRTVGAAKMLGAEVIITGLSAPVAQTWAALGLELSALATTGTRRAGVARGPRLTGPRVVSAPGEG